jgi:hypothetical protein
MANTYYSISPTTDTLLSIKNALQAKYGAGVTIHYQDAANLVFACNTLSNKVIKINYSNLRLSLYYGDAWTSGSTITNQVQWAGYSNGTNVFIDMILGDYTLMICSNQGTTILGLLIIIGKLTNDKYVCIAMIGTSTSGYYASYLGKQTSDNLDIWPVCFSEPFASATGKLFKQPLILQKSDGIAELNGDGSIASFRDIYNCSHALANNVDLVGSNYVMSSGGLYMINGKRLQTSIIAEF